MQLATIRTEMQEVKDQLTSENMVLGGKLASLEEFKVQKEDLMAKFARLEKELEGNKVEHKDVIYNLERKAVVDKDRWAFQLFQNGASECMFTQKTYIFPKCIAKMN